MQRICLVASLVMTACWAASGDRSTLPRSRITTCAEACDRIQDCAARTGRPSFKPREECERSCGEMAADSQRAYAKQLGDETSCDRMEPLVFLE